jgi:hypothetical protein
MNGLTAAKGLRRSVDAAGGAMRISVLALGDAFGRGRMTERARSGIEQVLFRAGLEVVPSLSDPDNDGWVTLQPLSEGASAPPPPPPLRTPFTVPLKASLPSSPVQRRRFKHLAAALAVIVPVLAVLAIVLPDSSPRPGRADAESTPRASTSPPDPAAAALREGDYTLAVRLTRQSDPAAVPALRARIARELVRQARAAQREKAYVRAIQRARRAARYGRAPGAAQIIAQSRAGLDLRRAEERRQRRASRRASR